MKPIVRRVRRAVAVLITLAATGTLAAVPGSANADTSARGPSVRVLADQPSDMWRMDWDERGAEYRPVWRMEDGDFLTARISHRRAVAVRMTFTDLERQASWRIFDIAYRTPDDRFAAAVLVRDGRWQGRLVFGDGRDEVRCAGASHELDYAANTLTVRIPSRCLGRPEWVKLRIQSWWERDSAIPAFFDNPHNHGLEPYGFTRRVWRG